MQLMNQLSHQQLHHANDVQNHLYEYILYKNRINSIFPLLFIYQYIIQVQEVLLEINAQEYQDDAMTMIHEYT